jgi:hypothetical protein
MESVDALKASQIGPNADVSAKGAASPRAWGNAPGFAKTKGPSAESASHFRVDFDEQIENESRIWAMPQAELIQRLWPKQIVPNRNVDSSKCEKAVDEIAERARVLGHECVPTSRKLSQPCTGNCVDEF